MKKKTTAGMDHIQYILIRDTGFSYKVPTDVPTRAADKGDIQLSINMEKAISPPEEILRVTINIFLDNSVKMNGGSECSYTTEHLFKIDGLENHINHRGDHYSVNDQLDKTISNIVYSTLRGLLHHKLTGTAFAGFLLPLTSPADFTIHPDDV